MYGLVPPHGGLLEPVCRTVPLSCNRQLLKEAADMPQIAVTKADLSMIYRIADGGLSPLTGPMDEATWHRVLDEEHIEVAFRKYAWTIPMSLPVTEAEAAKLKLGVSAALVTESGDTVGVIKVSSVFAWDKDKYLSRVYGTARTDHPGARIATDDPRGTLVGGEIWATSQPVNPEYGEYVKSPGQVRALIKERQWERVLAFQTRNPLHRAHEYALVAGLERITAEGNFTGAILNPLIGELKNDDVSAAARMRCYRTLHDLNLLGDGDKNVQLWQDQGYDLTEVFELIGLDIKMYYGGPKEAVMHAIYRQNYGFTDIVIGRKHADAPFDDQTAIWGDFDAQEIFTKLRGDLKIKNCNIGFAAYYESLGRADLMTNHAEEQPVFISGSKIRTILQAGTRPDQRILRPEISDILIEYYTK